MAPPHDYGPVQLADYLRACYGTPLEASVDRARHFGLIPGPDRGGGKRWSAALAEDIRARWPQIAAAAKCVGAYGLKERGWTEAMIRDLLGDPDLRVDNPNYKSAAPMRLWRLQRAEAIEASPEFASRMERAERQCAASRKGAELRQTFKALQRLGGGF